MPELQSPQRITTLPMPSPNSAGPVPAEGNGYLDFDAAFAQPYLTWNSLGLELTYSDGALLSAGDTEYTTIVGDTLNAADNTTNYIYWDESSTSLSITTDMATAQAGTWLYTIAVADNVVVAGVAVSSTLASGLTSSGGGGGTPGGSSGQVQFNNSGAFGGIAHSEVDSGTGNLTLGADFLIDTSTLYAAFSNDGGYIAFYPGEDGGEGGFTVDTEDANGTGNIVLVSGSGGVQVQSAGGISLTDSGSGITIQEEDAALLQILSNGGITAESTGGAITLYCPADIDTGIQLVSYGAIELLVASLGEPADQPMVLAHNGTGGITIDATGSNQTTFDGTGPVHVTGAGGITIRDTSNSGTGLLTLDAAVRLKGFLFADLPISPFTGVTAYITDSNTAVQGATIAGGGDNIVQAFYDGVNWVVTSGTSSGGGGSPAGASGTLQFNDSGDFGGVVGSSVDPETGDVTLGAGFLVSSPTAPINLWASGTSGLTVDTTGNGSQTGPGTGPAQFLSNGGIFFAEGSAAGIDLDATSNGGTGPLNLTSAGGTTIHDSSAVEGAITLNASDPASALFFTWNGNASTIEIATEISLTTSVGSIALNSGGGVTITDNSADGIFFTENGVNAQVIFNLADISETFEVSISGGSDFYMSGDGIGMTGLTSNLDLDLTTPGVITASTIINAVGGYQQNGVPLALPQSATLTLGPPQLLELSNTNALTGATYNGDGTTTYTGTFANGDANALVGGWYQIQGFSDANDGNFGPVSASSLISITVPNPSGITELGTATAANLGFQIITVGADITLLPQALVAKYQFGTSPYVINNPDNCFVLAAFAGSLSAGGWIVAQSAFNTTTGIPLTGMIDNTADTTFTGQGYFGFGGYPHLAQSVVISLGGTTAPPTGGDGLVQFQLQYSLV